MRYVGCQTMLAVETVYRSLDTLITVFSTEKEPKAKGYAKKIETQTLFQLYIRGSNILPIPLPRTLLTLPEEIFRCI